MTKVLAEIGRLHLEVMELRALNGAQDELIAELQQELERRPPAPIPLDPRVPDGQDDAQPTTER